MTVERSSEVFMVPVSIGEVVDKITILRIKEVQIKDPAKLANVKRELTALETSYLDHVGDVPEEVARLTDELQKINEALWTIEDDIRDCERASDFGDRFIQLARAVYVTNDKRAKVKREINVALGSDLVEEKSYHEHAAPAGVS